MGEERSVAFICKNIDRIIIHIISGLRSRIAVRDKLSTDYGYKLITHFKYGAVVDEIDSNQASQIQIPLLKNKETQKKINDLVLEANQKRYNAYLLEQQAINMVNTQVLSV